MFAASNYREGTVEARGAPIRYRQAGDGPALVLVEGAESPSFGQAHVLLSRGFRVIALGLPDRAAASGPMAGPAILDLSATLNAATEALGLTRFHLLGSGQACAVALAMADPSRIDTLVLAAPTCLPDAHGASGLRGHKMPTLILLGTHAATTQLAVGRTLQSLLPNSHVVHVYDAGGALLTERPEAVAEVVADFLARTDAFVISTTRTAIFP